MTHYSNDYFDRFVDALAVRTDFSGGSGVLIDRTLAPRIALVAAVVSLGLGLVGTTMLALEGHGTAALLAAFIAPLAWSYSSPPLRLLARGLGELDTALIVAILFPLCAYAAQNRPFTALALAASLPGAAAMFAMMLAVELPDIECDTVGGKRNLLVRAGRTAIVPLGQAALVVVYAGLMVAFGTGAPLSVVILGAVTIPAALGLGAAFARAVAEGGWETTSAARGVAFFFLVSASELFGYLVPLPWHI